MNITTTHIKKHSDFKWTNLCLIRGTRTDI